MKKPENITGAQNTQSAVEPVRYDIERMNAALTAERFSIPEGFPEKKNVSTSKRLLRRNNCRYRPL